MVYTHKLEKNVKYSTVKIWSIYFADWKVLVGGFSSDTQRFLSTAALYYQYSV